MLGAVSVVMETSSGVGCQEQQLSKKEKMAEAKCPPPTPNLITQYFKSPPKPEVTSPKHSGIMGYFKPMGKSPSQQLSCKQQGMVVTNVASPITAPKPMSEKDTDKPLKEKATKTKLKKVTKNKKPAKKDVEEVKDQDGNQAVDEKESGKEKELKKTGTESSSCSGTENREGTPMGSTRKSKKRKKSDVLNSSVDDFEAQPKKASKVSVSAVENLTTSQDEETSKSDKRTKYSTKTEDIKEEIKHTVADVKKQDTPQEGKRTKQSSVEGRGNVGGANHCKPAEEILIDTSTALDGSICEIDPGNDSVMMISYHDYLTNSQSEAEEEEDDKIITDVIDLENNDPEDSNNVADEIPYSDFLKGSAEEVKDNSDTCKSEDVQHVEESSNQEIPYEEFVRNISSTTGADDKPADEKPSRELLSGSPNSSGQGKVVTVEAQVHCLTEESVSKQKRSELLKQGKRASTPKTKGRKKSNVVVEEVDLVIEESIDNNKKVCEERTKIIKTSTATRDVDPETRARNEEIKKNFMANFRQPVAKKKAAETEENKEVSPKEEEENEKELENVKADKKQSVKSLQPASKSNTRARKPAKKVSIEKEDEEKESLALKKTESSDRKNGKKATTVAKAKKKTDNKATSKKNVEMAKEAESVEVVEPEVEETPTRMTRSGRKCVYRSQLLSMGSPNTPSPIRLRLTRVARRNRRGLDNQEDFTPKSKKKAKNAKVTKAQELVQKAKAQKSSKAKSKPESLLQPKVTRPKRQAAKPKSPEVVEITDEIRTSQTKRVKARKGTAKVQSPKGKKVVASRKKEGPKIGKDVKPLRSFLDVLGKKTVSSPKKGVCSPRKAAAIFNTFGKNVTKSGRSSPLTILDDDSRGSGSESSMDEATFAARRNFLMSGIPDRLRKQITITAAQAQAYTYPPFPTVSHVQQRDADIPNGHLDFWNLPQPREGSIPTVEVQSEWSFEGKVRKSGLHLGAVTTCTHKDILEREPRAPVPPLPHVVCKSLVAEIGTYCPGVPVRRVYKRYRSRYLEHQGHEHQEQDPSQTTTSQTVASTEPSAVKDKKSNKRKLSEVTEGQDHNTNKRKRTEEESEGQGNSPEVQESRKRGRLSRKSKMADRSKGRESNTAQQSDGEGGKRRNGRTKRNSSPSEEKEEPRRSSRRVSKKQEEQKKEDSEEEVKIVEAATESGETSEDGIQDSLWTDKYQPRSSSEVIGNTGAMKKLKGWLQDWKIRADKEMRRMMKEMKKQKKAQKNAAKKSGSQGSGDWWDDDDSDFDVSDDGDSDYNEEEEEDGLCNTMLVLGPTGIGKTSAVYACAQELGYKVFEVNAASLRSGKQVLTQLREATQSHQVSKQAQTGGAASLFKTSLTPQKVKPGANKAPLPSSFASFFKKTEDGKKEEDSKGPAGNKKVRRSLELGPSSGAKGNKKEKKPGKRRSSKGSSAKKSTEAKPATTKEPTRAMTSLILFEEVDVVFEDDKGFLPAINSLMTTTKRPIILTTSDATFRARFEGRYEELTFKQPLQPIVTSHLQLLCLAENLPTKRADVEATVALSRGDIRHAMLSLQFWTESGGGRIEKRMASDLHKVVSNTENPPQPVQMEESSQSQTCDTVDISAKPGDKTTMVLGPLPDDEDAMDADGFLSCRRTTATLRNQVLLAADDTCDSCPSSQEVAMATVAMETNPETVDVHSQCMESVLGIHNVAGCKNQLLEMFKAQDSDQGCLARQISLITSCQWQGRNLLFYNVEQLLPLPTTPWIRPKCNNPSVLQNVPLQDGDKERGRHRKGDPLLDSSLFDAEDMPSSQPKDATIVEDKTSLAAEGSTKSCRDKNVNAQSSSTGVEKEENVFKKKLICQALASFCELSENKSFLDMHAHKSSQKEGICKIDQSAWRAKVKSGMTDSVRKVEESDWRRAEMEAELRAAVEVMSLRQCARTVGKLAWEYAQDSGSRDLCEELTLPVVGDAGSLETLNLQDETQAQLSMFSTRHQTVHGVASALPNLTHGQHRAVALDYLPTLRSICVTEKLREASKLKRRFLHYLDNNGLSLKPSVLNALAQEF
ncbi:ATAD5 [Branchiostoma lanceolatum]|uniref:ATAD5 protein n=1 Tax=Branchiostoma lanceolatum TaxID=7740 RepID=A0A8K0AI49_BRALA|nr:ATAD5 [Branchiostoma lanceolatum]